MTIFVKRVIYCNECSYEVPNDYYFGAKDWIFTKDITEEGYHFCSNKCYESFIEDENNGELIYIKTLNSNDDEFRRIMNK